MIRLGAIGLKNERDSSLTTMLAGTRIAILWTDRDDVATGIVGADKC
jgi:hypothetical protein